MRTLNQLRTGERGTIAGLSGDDPVTVRLFELGLLAGEPVEVIGRAPLGDPLAVRVGGTRLAIRGRDAARIKILPLDAGRDTTGMDNLPPPRPLEKLDAE
jgi:ferrous iron transport protein A